jgi:hypothetical protein
MMRDCSTPRFLKWTRFVVGPSSRTLEPRTLTQSLPRFTPQLTPIPSQTLTIQPAPPKQSRKPSLSKLITGSSLHDLPLPNPTPAFTPRTEKLDTSRRIHRLLIILLAALFILFVGLAFLFFTRSRWTSTPKTPDMKQIWTSNKARISATPGIELYPNCPTCLVPDGWFSLVLDWNQLKPRLKLTRFPCT